MGLLVPITIELLQLLIGMAAGGFYRVVDVDDVILNILGVLVGRLVFAAGFPLWRRLTRGRRTRR